MKIGKFNISIKSIIFLAIIISITVFFIKDDTKSVNTGNPVPTTTAPKNEEEKKEAGGTPAPPPAQASDDQTIEKRSPYVEETQTEIDGHKFITSNDFYELYVKEENLSIIVRDKRSGAVMYSTVENPVKSNQEWTNFMKSGIVMEYLVGTNVVIYKADMYSGNPTKNVTFNENGFSAKIAYPELEIGFQVDVELTDSGVRVEIPREQVSEESDKFKVAGFYVYPFLGYSKLGERDGYMFIPDGSGSLIYLEDNDGKFKQPYSEMVYGSNPGIDDPYVLSLFNYMNPVNDPENILAPVFGMVQTDSEIGYLGIIEEGDFSAKIEAYPNGAILPYNWITSKFIYRQFYNQPTSKDSGTIVIRQKEKNNFDIKVRYDFVSGDNANYTGLALNYRKYLLENNLIVKQESDFKVRVDLLGADVENGMIFKKDVPMTTFEQAGLIYDSLQAKGVDQILSIYKGWQRGGVYGGLPTTNFKVDDSLGSANDLKELIEKSKQENVDIYLAHDALRINTEEHSNTGYKLMKKFNKRTYEEEIFGKVYEKLNYLQPDSTVEIMNKINKDYEKNQIENLMISGISNTLFSYSHKGKEYDRVMTKNAYESVITDFNESFNVLLEQPFAYLWKNTKAIVDLPSKSSSYIFNDEDIPFYAIALNGIVPLYSEYVNFQANQREFFLQQVEQGLIPSFYNTFEDPSLLLHTNSSEIYSSKYERYEETIVEYYKAHKQVHEQTAGALISDYERKNGVTKVSYDNGVVVYVNYKNQATTIDDVTIDGLSYKVVQGN